MTEIDTLNINQIDYKISDAKARNDINTLANTKIDENKANELINNKISSVLTYKGTLDSKSLFPMENNKIGDVYNAKDTGMNSAWDGEKWDDLGSTIDLSGYAKTTDIQESLNKADNSLQNIDGAITKNLLDENIQKQLESNIPILSLNFIPVTSNDNPLKNEYTISLEDWEKINNDQVCLLKFNFKHPQSQDNLINTFYFLKSYITSNDNIPTTDPNKKLTKIISFISGSGAMPVGIDLASFTVLSISNDLHCYLYFINLPQNKKDIGLELVDNTSDLDKPISTAAQTALDKKQVILVSGQNIATINGATILEAKDIQLATKDEIANKANNNIVEELTTTVTGHTQQLTALQESLNVGIIHFSVNNIIYSAIENMTFKDWVNSKLNVDGYAISGNHIQTKDKTAFIKNVTIDTIIKNVPYILVIKFYIDSVPYDAPLNTTWEEWAKTNNNFYTSSNSDNVKQDKHTGPDDEWIIKNVSKYMIIVSNNYKTWMIPRIILGVSGEGRGSWRHLTRTNDAVDLITDQSSHNGTIVSDFDKIAPYSEITEVIDDKGNKFVRIPKFYTKYTIESDGSKTTKISMLKYSDYKLNPCFLDNAGHELPYIDIGKYQASGTIDLAKSISGESPLVNISIDDLRTACKNNGSGYQQMDIWVHEMLATLFKIEFATTDSQSIMFGYLNSSNLGSIISGNCDSLGVNKSGSNGTNINNGKTPMTYRGIENLYGNINQRLDGIVFQDGIIYVNENADTYNPNNIHSHTYKTLSYTIDGGFSGWISKLGYDETNPFVSLPIGMNGDMGNYCDRVSLSNTDNNLSFGDFWCSGEGGGLWNFSSFRSSYKSSSIGGRLVRKPNYKYKNN